MKSPSGWVLNDWLRSVLSRRNRSQRCPSEFELTFYRRYLHDVLYYLHPHLPSCFKTTCPLNTKTYTPALNMNNILVSLPFLDVENRRGKVTFVANVPLKSAVKIVLKIIFTYANGRYLNLLYHISDVTVSKCFMLKSLIQKTRKTLLVSSHSANSPSQVPSLVTLWISPVNDLLKRKFKNIK